jgi:hypothetical protein
MPKLRARGKSPSALKVEDTSLASDKALSRDVSRRWTPALAKSWTPISDFFLKNYSSLNPPLTTPEAMLVIQLMVHKWTEDHPFPAFKTIAKRMGMTDTAVRAHARKLESKKYLKRIPRIGQPNLFDLSPLFEALERLQEEAGKGPAESE